MTASNINRLYWEHPMDFLRLIVRWADDFNSQQSIDDLTSFPAIVEAHYLTTVIYGIDTLDEIYDAIEEHGLDPKPYLDFLDRWDLKPISKSWRRPRVPASATTD